MERFKLLCVSVKRDADYEEFAVTYQQVYGEALEVALAEMSASAIHVDTGRWACRGEAVPWQGSEKHLHAELAGTCGDGHFYGGLRGDEQGAAFYKSFVVEVPRDGYYEMFVDGPLYGFLMSCGNTKLGLLGSTQSLAMGTLHAGLHELLVGFPRERLDRTRPRSRIHCSSPERGCCKSSTMGSRHPTVTCAGARTAG